MPVLNARADARRDRAGHEGLQGETPERGKAVGSGEGQELRDQVTKQNDNREDDDGGEPLRNA